MTRSGCCKAAGPKSPLSVLSITTCKKDLKLHVDAGARVTFIVILPVITTVTTKAIKLALTTLS